MSVLKPINNYAHSIFKIITYLFNKVFKWVERMTDSCHYSELFTVCGFGLGIIATLVLNETSFVSIIVKLLICFCLLMLLLYSFGKIVRLKDSNLEIYYKSFGTWFVAALYYSMIAVASFIRIYPILNDFMGWMLLVTILGSFYFVSRYFILKNLDHWIKFALLFTFLPLVAIFAWAVFGLLLAEIFKMPVIASDKVLIWMVLILTIVMLNLIIAFTPKERRIEAKLAVSFIRLISSSISACFFISDILARCLFGIKGLGFPSVAVAKMLVEGAIKWAVLPYLLGSLLGAFVIEVKERNDSKKVESNHKHFEGIRQDGNQNLSFEHKNLT